MLTFPTGENGDFICLRLAPSLQGYSAGMYETPTGNRWLKNVIEYTRCDRCRGVKYELQSDPPVQSIGK